MNAGNVFYIGANNGGVWKTTDYGRTWFPIFCDQATGSIGDVAVAPSNPNVIYVAQRSDQHRPRESSPKRLTVSRIRNRRLRLVR